MLKCVGNAVAIAFRLPGDLGLASYTIYADGKHASALFSGCGIWLLFSIPAKFSDL